MNSLETLYTPELTYEEILAFPARLIDRWAFDQTFIRTNGCVHETCSILQVAHTYSADLQEYPSEDLLVYLWLDRFEGKLSELTPSDLPMPMSLDLGDFEAGSLSAFRCRYCQDLLERFDGNKISVCESLGIGEWKLNRYLRLLQLAKKDDLPYADLDERSLAGLVEKHDSLRSQWIDVWDNGKHALGDLSRSGARFIVQTGLNFQLDKVSITDPEIAQILAEHRGGLSFGYSSMHWSADIGRHFAGSSCKIANIIGLDGYCDGLHESWDHVAGEDWFGKLLQSFVDQGETDFHWVRSLTSEQADILLNSDAERLTLPNLIRGWPVEKDGKGSIEKFKGRHLVLITDFMPLDDFVDSACSWGGSLVCNWPLSAKHPYERLESLWHVRTEFKSTYSTELLDRLSSIPGVVHLDVHDKGFSRSSRESLSNRRGPTHIAQFSGCRSFFPLKTSVRYVKDPDPRVFFVVEREAEIDSNKLQAISSRSHLDLSAFQSLDKSVVAMLAERRSGVVLLDGLEEIEESTAEMLSKMQGKLSLCGLRWLSDNATSSLAAARCDLVMASLTRLSDRGFEALRGCVGQIAIRRRGFPQKNELDRELARYPRTMDGLVENASLISVSQSEVEATIQLFEIGDHRVLAECEAIDVITLTIEGLPRVTERNACDLVRFKGLDLCLPDTTHIESDALGVLAQFQGQWIRLPSPIATDQQVIRKIGHLLP